MILYVLEASGTACGLDRGRGGGYLVGGVCSGKLYATSDGLLAVVFSAFFLGFHFIIVWGWYLGGE